MYIVKIMREFLKQNEINPSYADLIKEEDKKICEFFKINEHDLVNFDLDYIYKILTETYKLNSENVKKATKEFEIAGYMIGRNQKQLLNEYFNYGNENILEKFLASLKEQYMSINTEQVLEIIQYFVEDKKEEAKALFIQSWELAAKNEDKGKLFDYLMGIHSKILDFLNPSITLMDIFKYNEEIIDVELKKSLAQELKDFCKTTVVEQSSDIIKIFYDKYTSLLKRDFQEQAKKGTLEKYFNQKYFDSEIIKKEMIYDRGNDLELLPTEEYAMVHLHLSQKMYDQYGDKNKFLNAVINKINQIYRILENNKVFTLKIDNIISDGKNLKWELYSKLGIYCENFVETMEKSAFYKPEVICADMLTGYTYLLDGEIVSEKELIAFLKSYYKEKISLEEVLKLLKVKGLSNEELANLINDCKYIHCGFTFNDCFILDYNKNLGNNQIPFIKNSTEILMTFYKYRNDSRKIPCPACGGLKISGNSFPEIWHRSWECKSIICPERSKSNRGKRYSKKSNFMQWGSLDSNPMNIIDKEMIKKWRRDIVSIEDKKSIYEMLIKYYSFPSEKILFIEEDTEVLTIAKELERIPVLISTEKKPEAYVSIVQIPYLENNIYESFFREGRYIKRFLKKYNHSSVLSNEIAAFLGQQKEKLKLIHGNCLQVLRQIDDNTFTGAVTSPPYYNARDYSQWPNLYLYLRDMYNIILESYRTLKPGGVFLFNIGDIADNENTIVKSNMGKKRVLLGAYTIFLFQEAGYELIDNIIWDKGEVQSHRQKNDGKFTPHYQKPMNCYEHMFLFKKPGKDLILNENFQKELKGWDRNIVKFSPVIKINNKKENKFGHSAPFPKEIPDFVVRIFTQKSEDIVLDPFSGALTSAIVARQRNIIGLGIELSAEYVDVSIKRALGEGYSISVLDSETGQEITKVPELLLV